MLEVGLDYRPALLTSVGIGRYVRELSRALARRHDLRLHLFAHSWQQPSRLEYPPTARLHRSRLPGRSLATLSRFGIDGARLCGRPDVFHWTDYVHPPVRSTPVILTIHDLAFAEDPRSHGANQSAELLGRTRAAAARATRILVPSETTKSAVHRILNIPNDRIAVTPLGADHATRDGDAAPRPSGLPEDYAVAIGTIEPRKNHALLLAAWRRLGQPPLVVVGRPGWESDGVITELREEHAAGSLQWRQSVPDAELWGILRHAKVALYPSRHEGFGLPPVEALALGVPVVAGDNPCLREILGDTAGYCDPDDVDSLCDAWRGANDATHRSASQAAGRRRAARFTWADCAERTLAQYQIATS